MSGRAGLALDARWTAIVAFLVAKRKLVGWATGHESILKLQSALRRRDAGARRPRNQARRRAEAPTASYQIFVSHAAADRWVAAQFARLICELPPATVFLDTFDIAKGDNFEEQIFGALRRSQELIVLLTPWAGDRNWVWTEMGAARVLGIRFTAFLYGITLDQIERKKGGKSVLASKNVAQIDEFDLYLEELKVRIRERVLDEAS